MSDMRVLTVRQPWAHSIVHGGKDVENRVRNIAGSYRGPVAIHVGLAFPYTRDCQAVRDIVGHWPPVTDRWDHVVGAGHIIGLVDLTDVHSAEECTGFGEGRGGCSAWAESEGWHLGLSNPRPLAEPIPYTGALGLRHLDPQTTALITAQLDALQQKPAESDEPRHPADAIGHVEKVDRELGIARGDVADKGCRGEGHDRSMRDAAESGT